MITELVGSNSPNGFIVSAASALDSRKLRRDAGIVCAKITNSYCFCFIPTVSLTPRYRFNRSVR